MTQNFWPLLNINKLKLPEKIENCKNNFINFYNNKFQKRALFWTYFDSLTELEFKINKNVYILVLNTFQAAILLSFNLKDKESLNFKEIQSKLEIKDEDLKANLQNLILAKLIVKITNNEIINQLEANNNSFNNNKLLISAYSEDKYFINLKFKNNTKKLKIVSLPKNEDIIRKEKIEDDRSFAIEATIVRIMKSVQRIHHNELINKILNQLENFKVKIHMIKKKIDNLIEREIIQRDTEDSNYYLYSTN